MKKILLIAFLLMAGMTFYAQSTRVCLYEEFTGENCGPCYNANPALNALLALPTNTPKVIALKWEVPIPSAPSNTWSLYQTNKAEIDWRYRSAANGGYGYAINSAPSGKMDGQNVTVFGATSNHPANLNSTIISTAQSYTTPFSINLVKVWNAEGNGFDLIVNITSSTAFNANGALKLRTCMVERAINFSVSPGTTPEKNFKDVVIKSFPSIQTGIALPSVWTMGQSQSYTVSCVIPSYVRDVDEVALVSFIQDDGNRFVWQAARAENQSVTYDAKAVSVALPSNVICGNAFTPSVTIKNEGDLAITDMTITPAVNGVPSSPFVWTGNLAPGAITSFALNSMTTSASGGVAFSYTISEVSGVDDYKANNRAEGLLFLANGYQASPVSEAFASVAFPPASWSSVNNNSGPSWSRMSNVGAYAILPFGSMKYDFFYNTSLGDIDEMLLPPLDLSGANAPLLTFDIAKAFRTGKNDMLEVQVSANCGANWVTVYSKSGTALAVWQTAIPANYFPVTASEWRTDSVLLTGFNVPELLVKFVATNDNGNNMFIDNVNLSQSDPVGIKNYGVIGNSIQLYPNPGKGETHLIINAVGASKAKLLVLNNLGQMVFDTQLSLKQGENQTSFDTSFLSHGIYSIVLETEQGIVVKKLHISE